MRVRSVLPRRFLLFTAASAYLWAIAVTITGGFVLRTDWISASSRNPRGPLIVALATSAWYALRYRQHWVEDVVSVATAACARALVIGCACSTLAIGIVWGSSIAGGPDASGYVSQADMWVRGVLTLPAPEWARSAPWPNGVWSSAPIGFAPNHTGDAIAPMYSPGYPLMMALFQAVGGRDAVFLVVPLLGAIAVWASYVLGLRLGGHWAGASAGVLLTCSAPFLWMVVQPMSDVPAAACWTVALACALRGRHADAVVAGLATGAAVLVRPNLAPLTIVPALLLMTSGDHRLRRLTSFGILPVIAVGIIAAWNWHLNGSPLISGYGSLGQIYRADRIPDNLWRYASWLAAMQTPVIFLGLFAPFVVSRERVLRVAIVTTAFPIALLGMYLPWVLIDDWPYLRFLLPAYPALLAGCATVLVEVARRARRPIVAVAATALVVFVAMHSWQAADGAKVFAISEFDQRYARAVELVRELPRDAVIVSNLHSGTLSLYTGRHVLRFEVIPSPYFDDALRYLRDNGLPVYFVGDPDEVDYFCRLFEASDSVQAFRLGYTVTDGVVTYNFE